MATSTVLRVKRRLEDNPQDAIVLLCKRMKTNQEEISPSLFVFRGTVENQETAQVKSMVPKQEFKLKAATNVTTIIQKIRKEKKEAASESRYEIVKCIRGIKESNSSTDDDRFDLVDLQRTNDIVGSNRYTYDLYTPAKDSFDITILDNLVSIENCVTEMIFGTRGDDGGSGSDVDQDDDDDSNDENNWRNDYPDSESSSIDENDMLRAMQQCNLDDDDDDDDDVASCIAGDRHYEQLPDLFKNDALLYGSGYAKYKAKVQTEELDLADGSNYVQCSQVKDLDEEDVDGYKEDSSDDGFYYGEDGTDQFRTQYEAYESSDEYSPD